MSEDMTPPEEETPYVTAIRNKWQLDNKRKAKFRVVDGKPEVYEADAPASDLETTLAAARASEKRRLQEAHMEKIGNAQVGDAVAGCGILLGTWEPKDRRGKGLGKIFNVFAAPRDLTNGDGTKKVYHYDDAVECVASLRNWHGHDGTKYADDKEIFDALKNGSYAGGWFIPPRELLIGTDVSLQTGDRIGPIVQPDNIFDHKGKGRLQDTFATTGDGLDFPSWYWSSTAMPGDPAVYWNVMLTTGRGAWNGKRDARMSCRLVRLELKP